MQTTLYLYKEHFNAVAQSVDLNRTSNIQIKTEVATIAARLTELEIRRQLDSAKRAVELQVREELNAAV